jgi:anti-sigma B factor antagonist
METAVGVFTARAHAEEAIKSLLDHHVPEERIVFLTRSESEAKSIGKQLGAHVRGLDEGVSKISLAATSESRPAVPDVDSVFALGSGADAIFGGGAASRSAPSSPTGASEDFAFFRRVLNEGHSVIIVRTESSQIAATACEILNRLGLSMKKGALPKSSVSVRQVAGAVVAEFAGKIALAEGAGLLRDTVRGCLDHGHNRILLNLERIDFIDSAGLGELVRSHATVRGRGGHLTLVNPSANVYQLLRMTKLDSVFEIAPDEFTALSSLRPSPPAKSRG